MQARVFEPLGMTATTFDFERALRRQPRRPHALDIDGKPAPAVAGGQPLHRSRSVRPGGAWSSVRDVLKYVAMELAGGTLPDGKRFISESVLLERRAPQVWSART